MGIYDREYYRREGPSYLGSFAMSGKVCQWLVIINVIVYIVQLITVKERVGSIVFDHGLFTEWLLVKPERIFENFEIWRLLTGAFLHSPSNWHHIVWNMLALWFFGPMVEDLYGPKEFLAFYLTAGVVGSLMWSLATLGQPLQVIAVGGVSHTIYPAGLGASGAVLAVTILCAMHYPYKTVLFMFVLPMPLFLLAIILVAGDLYSFLSQPFVKTGVAVAAHLGGAGFAFLYKKLDWRLLNVWSGVISLRRRASRSHLRIYQESSPPARTRDEQLEAKADALLEKVAQQGLASLTSEERRVLQQASEQYKKRRT